MNANTVHDVANSLPQEELERLYFLIQKQIGKANCKVIVKKTKAPLISRYESDVAIWNHLNEVKKARFKKFRIPAHT